MLFSIPANWLFPRTDNALEEEGKVSSLHVKTPNFFWEIDYHISSSTLTSIAWVNISIKCG